MSEPTEDVVPQEASQEDVSPTEVFALAFAAWGEATVTHADGTTD